MKNILVLFLRKIKLKHFLFFRNFAKYSTFLLMKKIFLLFLSIFYIGILFSQNTQKAVIAFYNVENLFDTINDPNKNDDEFLPEGSYQWTGERYSRKLHNLAQVISLIGKEEGCPVVLGVSEIENATVLQDLTQQPELLPYKFKVAHHDSPDLRGVDVAFIYQSERFEMLALNAHRLVIPEKPYFITRDQVVLTGILDNTDTVNFIVNHWPSKRGGEARSLPLRIAAAQLTRSIVDSLFAINPNANIVIMGDFNDNPNAKSFSQALKPVNKIKDVKPGDIFNPMAALYQKGLGSYAYQDSWNMLDQIIISANLVLAPQNNYKYALTQIFSKKFMFTKTGSFAGYPFRTYAAGTYQGGYSDHLPVYIVLEK